MESSQRMALRVGKRAFILAFFILLGLMLLSGILTRVIQPGRYERIASHGIERVVAGSFRPEPARPYPVWRWFTASVAVALLFALATSRDPVVSEFAFPLVALLFLVGGIGGGLLADLGVRRVFSSLGSGALNMLPAVLLILMALSVKHIVDEGRITDTILHSVGATITNAPRLLAAFLVYLFTLFMNFFIGSASAKAFLMMPILAPLSDLVGITRQTTVLAFDFGDGFSNMIFPTNPVLVIALGLTVVSYPKWLRWTIGLQALVFLITLAFLALAVAIRFGPF